MGEEWRAFQMRFKPDGKAAFFTGEEQADSQDSRWGQGLALQLRARGSGGQCPQFILQGIVGLSVCFLVCREMRTCRCSEAMKGSRGPRSYPGTDKALVTCRGLQCTPFRPSI